MPKIGVRPLAFEKGKPTIEVGALRDLVLTLNTLIQAVSDGELGAAVRQAITEIWDEAEERRPGGNASIPSIA